MALFGNIEWGIRELDGHQILTATVDGVLYYENVGLCALLEHSNPSKALADWTDPKQRISLDVRGANSLTGREGIRRGNPNRAFVAREGANRLLIKSKAPGADRVHRWLADDVMPSIEDTGSYIAPNADVTSLDLNDLGALEKLNLAFGHAIAAAKQERSGRLKAEARVAELEPAAAQAETYAEADGLTTKRAFARDVQQWATSRRVKVTQQQVFDFLAHLGLITRLAGSEHDQATAQAIKDGKAKNATKSVPMPDGTLFKVKYGKLTSKGEQYAWKRIYAAIGEHGTLDLDVIRRAVVPVG
ncbi:phage antirepressor KilAC domain-containing protein [Nonomuraea typhae]|uniref:Phage antirepressor KilAC domain-containing protein n=1 Tax=Nonomuraea typhae TaxID=2603600 RepID=A0ABW7YLW1_9ACTN